MPRNGRLRKININVDTHTLQTAKKHACTIKYHLKVSFLQAVRSHSSSPDIFKWVVKHKPCLSASDAVISDILILLQIIEESRLMKETVLKQSVSIVLPIKLFVCSLLCKSLQLTFHCVELPNDRHNERCGFGALYKEMQETQANLSSD